MESTVSTFGLARALNVHPSSVYHYFENRASILSAVAGHILRDIEVPQPDTEWQAWAVDMAMNYWKLLSQKPFCHCKSCSPATNRPHSFVRGSER